MNVLLNLNIFCRRELWLSGRKKRSENMVEAGVTKKKYICAVFIYGAAFCSD